MPYLAGKGELSNGMRDRQSLFELRSMYDPLSLFSKGPVRVYVKSVQIFTEKNRRRLSKSPNVKFRRNARMNPPDVADSRLLDVILRQKRVKLAPAKISPSCTAVRP